MALNDSEFLKLSKESKKGSALSLFFASLFYLIVFIFTTIYIAKSKSQTVNDMINKKVSFYGINPTDIREGNYINLHKDKTHLLNKDNKIIN